MRRYVLSLLCGLLLLPGPAAAQEAEALRRALEQMREQMESMKSQYDQLNERLRRLESPPPAMVTPPAPSPAPVVTQTTPGPTSGKSTDLTPVDILRPRPPFSLYQQRGAGQLLFDMGLSGDFVANFTSRRVERAGAGTFAGQENRFIPREIELNLFGQIDPYASAYVRIEAGEGGRGQETGVSLAEAALTLLTLPYGTQAKLGQVRTRFGYSNEIHEHDLPWVDRPNVLRNFLGDEGLVEKGVEVTIIPDLPFYLQGLVGVFNGDNETSFGRGSLRSPLVTARLRTFLELSDTSGIQFGISGATGQTGEEHRSSLLGVDLKYKYRPEGWLHPLFTLGGEALYNIRTVDIVDPGTGAVDTRTLNRWGWYAYAELQPWRRWAGGVRHDWSQFPVASGREWAVEPYLTFWPSGFLRFRLAYKHTQRSQAFVLMSERSVNEVFLQGTFLLGAHPADPF